MVKVETVGPDDEELTPDEIARRKAKGQQLLKGRKAKAAKAERDHKRELRKQLAEAEKSKDKTDREYLVAMKRAARKKDFDAGLWNRADSLMSTSLQLAVTIKNIKRQLEGST